jgi:peptidyl-prolyl cis-trans isomerase B (cyclophilin B)
MTARTKQGWLAGALLGLALAGCGQAPASDPDSTPAAPSAATPAAQAAVPLDPRLHQPFLKAASLDPPDDEEQRPPDTTKAGKVVGKLFAAVVGKDGVGGLWDQVQFATPDGKRLNYLATIRTDLGTVVIELWPDVAPNHVRNFVALARAGYYDGLDFDQLHREELVGQPESALEYVVAGCPLGTGEPGYGSIGYWLLPEVNEQLHHEEGTVGAWHGYVQESAACKFYITLTKAPLLDGNFTIFGKVRQGLEVVRTISSRPRRSEPGSEERPVEPVVMRQVTIETSESSRAFGPANP